MRSILEEMWYGNLNPQEQSTEGRKETQRLLSLMGRNRDELCSTLTEAQKITLEKYDDCLNEMNSIIERDIFIHAFSLGGKIMLEMLTNRIKE